MISQQYRTKRELSANTKMRFVFDGETIEPDQTPEDLEIEDEDCVDVLFWDDFHSHFKMYSYMFSYVWLVFS